MAATLESLLSKTSRTFAKAIPALPEPTREAVGVAYLLFRIADTFEDATAWSRAQRLEALRHFAAVLRDDRAPHTAWPLPPVAHEGYLELLRETPRVLEWLNALPAASRELVVEHALRTTEGMAQVVEQGDDRGTLRLASVAELQRYCYVVAGIVGELLTALFLVDFPSLAPEARALQSNTIGFGEGLQLVNILKDASDDARDGRVYLPVTVPRAEIFRLARADLEQGAEYVRALQRGGAPRGVLVFTGFSLVLAAASLELLERRGPGAKVTREEVGRLYGLLEDRLAAGVAFSLAAR